MNKIFRLALRNLTRQKRRNAILAIAIGFGFFVVTAIDGLTTGAVNNLEDMITQLSGGSVMIGGFQKMPTSLGSEKSQTICYIEDREYIQSVIDRAVNKADIKTSSQYTSSSGAIVFAGNKTIAQISGRDFKKDKDLVDSFKIVEGSVEDIYAEDAIVVAQSLAESLNLQINDVVTYSTSTISGQANVGDFRVAAIIEDNTFISSMFVYANIETLNKLVEIPEGGYSYYTILLKNKKKQAAIAQKIEETIRQDGNLVTSRLQAIQTNPTNIGKGLEKQISGKDQKWDGIKYFTETLDDEVPAIKTVLNVVHTVTTVILLVILLIVMVGISNTYRMVLYERIREIGTMRALGMSGKDTGRVFTTEAVILSILGACAGIIVAIVVMVILGLPTFNSPALSMFMHNNHITFNLTLSSIITQYILMIILTALAVRGSAKQASNMSPAEALRTVK